MTNYDILKEYEAHQTPVPSYEEWQASEKYNKHLEEKIKVYERKDKQATETSIAYNELAKENEELKEILERHKKATAKAQIRSCDLEIINAQLKEQINHLIKTQARQFVDNQKLQVKAEKAKDVVNIDTARQIKQLKELLKECRNILHEQTFHRNTILETDETLRNRIVKKAELLTKIDEVLK